MIFTIKIDDPAESLKLSNFLKNLTNRKVSVISEDTPKNPAIASSISDFRNQINDARKDVADGNVISHDEMKAMSEKW